MRTSPSAPPGADGLVLIPYLEGERTPNKPDATGAIHGMRLANTTPAHLARAEVEGLLCAMADGLDALRAMGVPVERIQLIGGGARGQRVAHPGCVGGGEVDLVRDAVEGEGHGLVRCATVDVVNQDDLNLLCHRFLLSSGEKARGSVLSHNRLQHVRRPQQWQVTIPRVIPELLTW